MQFVLTALTFLIKRTGSVTMINIMQIPYHTISVVLNFTATLTRDKKIPNSAKFFFKEINKFKAISYKRAPKLNCEFLSIVRDLKLLNVDFVFGRDCKSNCSLCD